MSLKQAQQSLWRAVRYDPAPADALERFVDGPRLDAASSLAVYRNMYWYRQVEALGEMFPRTREVLGPERFTKLACKYIRQHPSQHPALEFLGRALPDFLHQHVPEQAGLARLEWFRNLALLAPDPEEVARAGDIVPDAFASMRFTFVPSLHVTEVDRGALMAFSPDAAQPPPGVERVSVATWRRGFGVRHLALDAVESKALMCARRGATVAELLGDTPDTDAGIQRAFHMIRDWLARHWVERLVT